MEKTLETIRINVDIDNGLKANNVLSQLSEVLESEKEKEVRINFDGVGFIAANQLAVLGALFDEFCVKKEAHIYLDNLKPNLRQVMQKNGFGQNIGLDPIKDRFHTTIPYKHFRISESTEFEKYLIMHIFQRTDIPVMTEAAKNAITDNILEVFNNVKEHTSASYVYACGQFFPKSKKIYFSIVDIGETIKENVDNYFKDMGICKKDELRESNHIQWAMMEGNSTRKENSPGGLGFSILSKFIALNKGELSIVSDDECYEFKSNKYRTRQLAHRFKGTIVTVAINMSDTFSYLAINDSIEQIVF